MAIRTISVCSGAGGFDLAVELGLHSLGFDTQPLLYVEREVAAARILAARIEEGSLGEAGIWSDLASLDATCFRGMVDLIYGGLPCQPFSAAGKQLGDKDPRFIWPSFYRILEECEPSVVFLENVGQLVTRGSFRGIGTRLSELGYEIEDPCFLTAQEVGASHKRERVFLLAHRDGVISDWFRRDRQGRGLADASGPRHQEWRCESGNTRPEQPAAEREGGGMGNAESDDEQRLRQCRQDQGLPIGGSGGGECDMANAESRGFRELRDAPQPGSSGYADGGELDMGDASIDGAEHFSRLSQRQQVPSGVPSGIVANAEHAGRPSTRATGGPCAAADMPTGRSLSAPSLFAPGPRSDEWGDIIAKCPHLRPAIRQAEVERILCELADGLAGPLDYSRTDALRASGNGCVSLQGALALRILIGDARARAGRGGGE